MGEPSSCALMHVIHRGRSVCGSIFSNLWASKCHKPFQLQDYAPREFVHFVQQEWNATSKVPMHLWLNDSQRPPERSRLHQLGNCVVPAAARLAFEVLLKMKRQAKALEA